MSELNFLQAIILSVIQAITEFIPVSSSAHLLLPSKFIHEEMQEMQGRKRVLSVL